jgi:hypothetical protein
MLLKPRHVPSLPRHAVPSNPGNRYYTTIMKTPASLSHRKVLAGRNLFRPKNGAELGYTRRYTVLTWGST